MDCLFCNQPLRDARTDLEHKFGDVLVSAAGLPVLQCPGCGERYLSGRVLTAMEALAADQGRVAGRRRVEVTLAALAGGQ